MGRNNFSPYRTSMGVSTELKKRVGTFSAVLLGIGVLYAMNPLSYLDHAVQWMTTVGPLKIPIFLLLYVFTCVFLLPGGILTYSSGLLFGIPFGIVMVSLGVVLGSLCSFLIARYWSQEWVQDRIVAHPKFEHFERLSQTEGWKLVLLCRLCPIVPFRISSYFFGITKVPLLQYVFCTWLGTLPGITFYVLFGRLSVDILFGRKGIQEFGVVAVGGILVLGTFLFLVQRWKKRMV